FDGERVVTISMPVRTLKHCRQSPEPSDGRRLLVMRFWPRGMHRTAFHQYIPALAPSAALLSAFRTYRASFCPSPFVEEELWERYRAEMALQRPKIEALTHRHLEGETITLLCACHDPTRCHRTALGRYVLDPGLLEVPHGSF